MLQEEGHQAPLAPVRQGGAGRREMASAAGSLSEALWLERRHLAAVLAALPPASLASVGAKPHDAAPAVAGRMLEDLRVAGLVRALAVDALARIWGVRDLTLPDVVAGMPPEPWSFIFSSHRDSMLAQLYELRRHHGLRSSGCAGSLADGSVTRPGWSPSPFIPRPLWIFVSGSPETVCE